MAPTSLQQVVSRISYHAVYDESISAALAWAAENGFSGVQIAAAAPHFRVRQMPDTECERIRSLLSEKKLRLTLHAHDANVSLFECNQDLSEGILNYYHGLFAAARRLGATMVTIHLGAPTTFPAANGSATTTPRVDLDHWRRAATENLGEIVKLAADGPLICIENVNLTSEVSESLQPFLDRSEVALCWDIPKCYDRQLNRDKELEAYLISNLAHVRQVHLHDLNAEGRSHQVIGTGEIDFLPYLEKLAKAEVLDYCLEVRPREEARACLEALKKLLL